LRRRAKRRALTDRSGAPPRCGTGGLGCSSSATCDCAPADSECLLDLGGVTNLCIAAYMGSTELVERHPMVPGVATTLDHSENRHRGRARHWCRGRANDSRSQSSVKTEVDDLNVAHRRPPEAVSGSRYRGKRFHSKSGHQRRRGGSLARASSRAPNSPGGRMNGWSSRSRHLRSVIRRLLDVAEGVARVGKTRKQYRSTRTSTARRFCFVGATANQGRSR